MIAGWGFRKSRRASRRVGRFRPVPEIEARVSERESISSSFRNLEGLSWEGVAFSVCQKSRHRSGEGAQFGHVSGISDIVPAIWSIPQCFSRGGERLGEGLISRSFQKKAAVGRAVVWTVGRFAKTWQRRCTCSANVSNVSGFKSHTLIRKGHNVFDTYPFTRRRLIYQKIRRLVGITAEG